MPFALPPIESVKDLPDAAAAITATMAAGAVTPREAMDLLGVVELIGEAFAAADEADRAIELLGESGSISEAGRMTQDEAREDEAGLIGSNRSGGRPS